MLKKNQVSEFILGTLVFGVSFKEQDSLVSTHSLLPK